MLSSHVIIIAISYNLYKMKFLQWARSTVNIQNSLLRNTYFNSVAGSKLFIAEVDFSWIL